MLLADAAAHLAHFHPNYDIIAGHIEVTRLHKSTPHQFSTVVDILSSAGTCGLYLIAFVDLNNASDEPLLAPTFCEIVRKHAPKLDAAIVHGRDFALSL